MAEELGLKPVLDSFQQLNTDSHQEEELILSSGLQNAQLDALVQIYNQITKQFNSKIASTTAHAVQAAQTALTSLQNSTHSNAEEAAELISLLQSPTILALLRCQDAIASGSFKLVKSIEGDVLSSVEKQQVPVSNCIKATQVTDNGTYTIIEFTRGEERLGITLGIKKDDGSVHITKIGVDTPAHRCGWIRVGDEVDEVNGTSALDRDLAELSNIVSTAAVVTLKLRPGPAGLANGNLPVKLLVQTLTDFDPSKDEQMPLREAGLAYKRRDVLVLVTWDKDSDWWQAYFYGDTVIGLVPSKKLCEKRLAEAIEDAKISEIAANLALQRKAQGNNAEAAFTPDDLTQPRLVRTRSRNSRREKKGSKDKKGTFLRAFSMTKKGGAGGMPTPAQAVVPVVQVDPTIEREVVSYQEVLYFNSLTSPTLRGPSRGFLLILVGPMGVGRTELCQRLLDDLQKDFASPVPYTSRPMQEDDVDGRDYFFISREELAAGIERGEYLEHDEFEGHLYGTTHASVKAIFEQGKGAVLRCHPRTLSRMVATGVGPFVAFIKPPTIDVLRRLRRGEPEETLAGIVKNAEAMETAYGHHFDARIVMQDFETAYDTLVKLLVQAKTSPRWLPIAQAQRLLDK
eukprot:Colp12_sorted_trinity150504_noHs@27629